MPRIQTTRPLQAPASFRIYASAGKRAQAVPASLARPEAPFTDSLRLGERPQIRRVDPRRLGANAQAGLAGLKQLTADLGPVSPRKLSLSYHHQQLNHSLRRILHATGEQAPARFNRDPALQEIVSRWRAQQLRSAHPASAAVSAAAEQTLQPSPLKQLQSIQSWPQLAPLKQRLQQRIQAVGLNFQQGLERDASPRLKALGQTLGQGLHNLQRSVEAAAPDVVDAGRRALTVFLSLAGLEGIAALERPALQLQSWALSLEDRVRTGDPNEALAFRDLLEVTGQFTALKIEEQGVTGLLSQNLQAYGGAPWQNQAVSSHLFELLDTLDAMTPHELRQSKRLVDFLQGAQRTDIAPAFGDLQRLTERTLRAQAELADEVLLLIQRADALALRELAPTPEAPREFPNGVLSLIQYFKQVLIQLDSDQQALIERQLRDLLQQREQDNQIIAQILEAQRHEQISRAQQDRLIDEAQRRYEEIRQDLLEN